MIEASKQEEGVEEEEGSLKTINKKDMKGI